MSTNPLWGFTFVYRGQGTEERDETNHETRSVQYQADEHLENTTQRPKRAGAFHSDFSSYKTEKFTFLFCHTMAQSPIDPIVGEKWSVYESRSMTPRIHEPILAISILVAAPCSPSRGRHRAPRIRRMHIHRQMKNNKTTKLKTTQIKLKNLNNLKFPNPKFDAEKKEKRRIRLSNENIMFEMNQIVKNGRMPVTGRTDSAQPPTCRSFGGTYRCSRGRYWP